MKTLLAILMTFCINSSAAVLSSSVLMFHEWEFESCSEQVHKSSLLNNKYLTLMYTFHFKVDESQKLTGFCLKNKNNGCSDSSEKLISKVKSYYTNCLQKLNELKIKPTFLFHIDEWGNNGIWRNYLKFDPLVRYGDRPSYNQLIIEPLLDALEENDIKQSDVAIQGEMGATVFHAPKSYESIVKNIQKRGQRAGLSLNYNRISGKVKVKVEETQKLFNNLDFLGFSAYAPLRKFFPMSLKTNDFKKYKTDFLLKLKNLGLYISSDLPLQFSEIGIGGGNWKNDGHSKADSPKIAAKSPYAGIWHNPDGQNNPWSNSKMIKYRFIYHKQLINFLKKQKLDENNFVEKAFLWNANSWDVQGLYKNNDLYRDEEIVKFIMQNQ